MARAGLDADVVVRHASALIDEQGIDALTLARVASGLGVATPSLYKHIGGLDDLLDRVAAAATADLAARLGAASRGRSGRDALQAVADAYRRFAREHPGTYPLTQRNLSSDAWAAAAADAVASVAAALSGYGVDEGDVDSIRFVRAALHGFVDLERRGGFGLPVSVDQSFAFLVDALDATLRTLDSR
ncbi:TetR/AcrR family transcriptional regulator [Cellulomonas chengniuliangii]|uniref:WHG domain-containing protein n=1 Tax=Cellulomonas chengniuliangii TaxID=2968084 RepID=A0ABY5L2Y3_9CELL|nr:TetR/AcrR family transcriptional regulator [Cellulomonas chengniuliangii]MCC2309509.1 WHG domain-containing protein [Cellulomonas chengniuliangii]UUI74933.1 WHG domain-containing protein [Cellulomonas chengniuliangii]